MSGRTLGLILAGGRSRRMGRDKAFVPLAGKPLLAHVIARLAPAGMAALDINLNTPADLARAERLQGWRPLRAIQALTRHYSM